MNRLNPTHYITLHKVRNKLVNGALNRDRLSLEVAPALHQAQSTVRHAKGRERGPQTTVFDLRSIIPSEYTGCCGVRFCLA